LVATGYRLNPKLGMWVANSGTDTRKWSAFKMVAMVQ
jgi:hypothetical protein